MKLIKNINYNSTFHYYKSVIDIYLAVKNKELPEQVIKTLIFFIIYGINKQTYKLLVERNIASSLNIVSVYKTRLSNEGLIIKVKKTQWEVIPELNIKENIFTFTINLTRTVEK